MGAEVPMVGTLTEAAAFTVEAIPVSAEADSPSAVLAVEGPCRPPGWAGGTRTRDKWIAVRTRSPEGFLPSREISRAVQRSEGETSAHRQTLAISVIPELRNRRRKVPAAPWAGGSRLETRPFGRRLDWHAHQETRWAAGIPSAT
jgi:hypothetical protein